MVDEQLCGRMSPRPSLWLAGDAENISWWSLYVGDIRDGTDIGEAARITEVAG